MKWSVKMFEEWQRVRAKKWPGTSPLAFHVVILKRFKMTVQITEMSAASLNFWLTKIVGEVVNKNGGRYPSKTLYQIISRHILDVNVENGINVLNKSDQR